MRLFFLTKYSRLGASSRYRSYQYLPALESAGLDVNVSPLFDDDYLQHKYETGRASKISIFQAFFRRFWAVLTLPRYSVVFIEYELLPYVPAFLERWLHWRSCRMIVDYDDALFHQYDQHSNTWIRRLLGTKIADVMQAADTVVVGNRYLADYAHRNGASDVVEIPTVVDLGRYSVSTSNNSTSTFSIGWIGSPSTAPYLRLIATALSQLCQDPSIRLHLIGLGSIDLPGINYTAIPWSEKTEVEELHRLDVGIMPLPDEPWARGKCGFKLIQYMACGLPVVASPVGVNTEIVTHGVNGYLAETTDEWVSSIRQLQANPKLRHEMGAAGRKRVEEKYSLAVTTPMVLDLVSPNRPMTLAHE